MCLHGLFSARSQKPSSEAFGSTAYFTCTRLNTSTFRIVEDDSFGESPLIYVKINLPSIVVIDTGCGADAAADPKAPLTSLRDFIERCPIPENGGAPLNPAGAKPYTVMCTHCHYDHICGIADFDSVSTTQIWASGYNTEFLSRENLGKSSLCEFLGIETPEYTITNWAEEGQAVTVGSGQPLPLTVYQVPGHTPDQMAIWDSEERQLYVGDMAYLDEPILILQEGSAVEYKKSLTKLQRLVDGWNAQDGRRAKISCGHRTSNVDASAVLGQISEFLQRIVLREIQPEDRGSRYGMQHLELYSVKGERVSFHGPRSAFDELRASLQGRGANYQ